MDFCTRELAGPLRALRPAQAAETGPHPGPPILVWPAPTCWVPRWARARW